MVSQLFVKAFAFGYTFFLAGNLGPDNFGTYSAALSIFGLMSLFSDLGINRVLTRDIARDESELPKLFSTAMLLRALSAAVSFLVLTIFFYLTDPSNLRFQLTTIALLSLIPQSIALSVDAILIALKKVSISALGFFLFNMVSIIIGSILIFSDFGVYGAITAFLLGQIFYAIFLAYTLLSSKKIDFKPFDLNLAKTLLMKSWKYGILSAIGFASFRIDTVFLSYIRGGVETGNYALAYRFFDTATIIPVALGTVLYPVFSQQINNHEITKKLFKQSILAGLAAGVLVLVGINITLPLFLSWFLERFLPDGFAAASPTLAILSLALPFVFMHIPMGQLLLSREGMLNKVLLLYLFVFIINLALMLTIIPIYGSIGAAWITVIVEALTFISFYIFVKTKILKN